MSSPAWFSPASCAACSAVSRRWVCRGVVGLIRCGRWRSRAGKSAAAALKAYFTAFAAFALADPARRALLFQRPIPGFEPSAESYAYAQEVLARGAAVMHAAGVEDPGDVDCLVAMVAGLIDAQVSNDPGGRRWIRHLDRLTDMYLDDVARRSTEPRRRKRS